MSQSTINLPANVIVEIRSIFDSGQDFFKAYEKVLAHIPDSDERSFWFEQAALINNFANNREAGIDPTNNLASTYIIAHSAFGLKLDKKQANLAETSNAIATRVLQDILDNSGVRPLNDMLADDIAAALEDGGQTIGGWGGSFYYWDLEYNGGTVGSNILSSAAELEKFIASSVVATVAVVYQELGEGYTYGQAKTAINAALDANLPNDLKFEIIEHTLQAMFYGQVFAEFTYFGDWAYDPVADNFYMDSDSGRIIAEGDTLAFLHERLKYRLDSEIIPRADYIDEVINDLNLGFEIKRPQECFPAGTLVTLFDGTTKTIETVTPSDTVLSHNTNGTAVPGHVTQLLENVTDTWLVLSRVDDPEWSTTVTPGHRYLRPDGSYAEIKDIVSGGAIGDGRIVDVDGHVVEVQAEVVRYSEQTAHLYEQHALYKTQSTGGLALQPEYVEGWRTYNFTVATHHNYVANDIRVHNDSILSTLQEGDTLFSLDDGLNNMAVLRDVDGDGVDEVVINQGYHVGDNLIVTGTSTYTAPSGVTDTQEWLRIGDPNVSYDGVEDANGSTYTDSDGNTQTVDLYSNPVDPGFGNGLSDGVVADDLDEIMIDDLGFTKTTQEGAQLQFSGNVSETYYQLFDPLGNEVELQEIPFVGGFLFGAATVVVFTLVLDDGSVVEETMNLADTGLTGFGDISSFTLGDGSSSGWGDLDVTPEGGVNSAPQVANEIADQDGTEGTELTITVAEDAFSDADEDTLTYSATLEDGSALPDWLSFDGTSRTFSGTPPSGAAGALMLMVIASDGAATASDVFELTIAEGSNEVIGTDGDDVLTGLDGDEIMTGLSGNDVLLGSTGADQIDGGEGSDRIEYSSSSAGVTVSFADGTSSGGDAEGDVLTNIENVKGSLHVDVLTGDDETNIMYGLAGADVINSGAGDDKVYAGLGDDTVDLGAGDDYVLAGDGKETFTGGAGDDYISYYYSTDGVTVNLATDTVSGGWAEDDTISGFENISGSSTGDDVITGTDGANIIKTYGGADVINSGAGDDKVYSGLGDDVVDLGDGDDYVLAGDGSESFTGGAGDDYISYYYSTGGVTVNLATNTVSGGWAEDDTVSSFESISGSFTGDDVITGTDGTNIIKTYGGNDVINSGAGDDKVYSGLGDDVVDLGDGDDYVLVGDGTETFTGGAGDDYISYYYSTGGVTVNLAAGTVSGGWAEDDTVSSFESISGSFTGDDVITGTDGANIIKTYGGNDIINSGAGDDKVYAGLGDDTVDLGDGDDYVLAGDGKETFAGGAGDDYISYYYSTDGVTVNLATDTVSGGWAEDDTVSGFENISGSSTGDDMITGTDGANIIKTYGGDDNINSGAGDDTIYAGEGHDNINGGAGADILYGGIGRDIFYFDVGGGHDTIKDISVFDRLLFDDDLYEVGKGLFDYASQSGSDVVFEFNSDDIMTIEDTTIQDIMNMFMPS